MKDKRKDGEGGGRPRGSRKNIIGSESQALLQAAAGSGFIGFSAFHTPATPAFAGAPGVAGGGTSPPSVKASGGTGSRGQRRVKTAKVDGGRSSGSAGQVLPPHYSGGNSHLAVVSKRLSKRDVITKLKALAELRSMCRLVTDDGQAAAATAAAPTADSSATSAEDLGGLAPHWIFLYQRLSAEGDRRTREAANATLLCMLRANRRAFQPLMRSLMGAWWCSQADTAAEVSASAKEAFDAIFPEAKRASVLRRCAGGVLSHINTAVHQTPEMLEESSGCTAEEAEKRAERLTVSALSALSNLLGAVGDEANSDLCAPSADGATGFDDDAAQSHQAAYPSVVNENLWARLDDPRPAVRRAAYALVSACCRHAPGLLRHPAPAGDPVVDAVKVRAEAASSGGDGAGARGAERGRGPGVGRKRSRVATPQLLVGLLSEKEELNHREAWQAALLVLREFRETWAAEKGAAAVLPTLLTRLRKGAFLATSGTSYPCLLPLLASFPLQTLLAPADGRAGAPPFCATLLETLWTTMSNPGGGDGGGGGLDAPGGERGGSSGWLGDVASAHVECATFLLLKLPPPPTPGGNAADDAVSGDYATAAVAPAGVPPPAAGGVGEEDPASVAVGVSAAVDNVIRVVKSLAVDGGEEDAAAGTGEGLGGGRVQRTARQSPIVREAFSRALGQLHLGAEKGTGVMGSATESAALWGAVLRELKGALDQRSWDGTRWMGNVLARALATVNGRRGDDAVQSTPAGPKSIQGAQDGGGLRGVCRALFLHCAVSIGYVEGAAEGEGLAAISPRDSPLVAFMSTVVDALGVDGVFRMREPTRPGDSGPAGGAGGGDTIGGALSRDAATEFYDKFLVPRLVASSSSSSATSAVDGVEALKTVAERFLVAEDASRQTDGFRLLLGKALAEDGRGWMRTATMVLRLAPPGMARDFPEINAAVLRACGVSAPGAEPPSPPRPTEARPGRPAAQDLPALLQASLGVREGRAVAGPFIKPSTVSEVVKVAISPADLSSAALEGLLGVLAAGGSAAADAAACGNAGADDDGAPEDDALATVRKEGLSLLLAAFSGFGGRGGTGADRLWRDCGAPVLEALVVAGGDEGSTSASASPRTATEDPLRRRGVLQDFLGGAVERTRSAMEDGGSGDGAERAATLAWALVDLQRTLRRRWRRGEGGAAALPQDLPVLWRLGLTCPSVWRERRLEALAGSAGAAGATAAATAATAADLARACVGSRWARRWECVSLILARLPDERARLSVLAEGVVHADEAAGDGAALGVAGEALHEILAAGVVVSRAERLLEGKGYGGIGTGDRLSVDLPPRLLSSPAASMGGGRGGFEPVEEFGLGLPRFLGFSPPTAVAAEQPGAVAAVAAAGVLDAMAVHLGKTKTSGFKTPSPAPAKAAEAESSPIADSQRQHRQQHPFSLLLPQGLWRAAFRPPSPSPSPSPAAPEDLRLHGVLLSAFLSAVKGMAEDAAAAVAAGGCVGGAGEAGAWRVSCSAEISTGLVVAVVGETFTRGLGLGDNANRLMATRCGVFKAPTPSAADLLPGARTLYTSDGQAVTVVAAHVDPGGGEGYYTVRPIPEPGAVAAADPGRERQTILERLSVLPPPSASPRRTREGTATGVSAACPWLVRPSVAGKLGALVAGPFLAIEQGLWEKLGRSSAGSGPEGPALVSAAAAALRGLASTCVRAALLCGDGDGVEDVKEEPEEASAAGGDQVWEGVRSRVLALRNRWASAAVKSGSAAVAARVGGGSSPLEATATLALSTAVLSGFLAATPLLPSDEEGMRLMPVRVRGALLAEAEAGAADAAGAAGAAGAAASSAAADAALGWARAQRAASLAWLRDCAEASTMVHVSPSAGSLDSQIFLDTQAEAEAAVVALASAGRAASAVGGGGSVDDLALARACGGLFAGESSRLSRGHPTTLSCESKAAVVSWAVSKFLLSGGRMASSSSAPPGRRAESGGVHDDISLCLETARLLTAIAWDGREGWGGAGGAASASAAAAGLVGARVDDRSRVWEAARAPAVWRGLHAAVVGAVGSPMLQLCAFEVLEAAAADWPCAVAAPSPEGGGDDGAEDGKGAGGTGAGSGGEGEDGGGATAPEAGGQSIVSRLAKALGGWGLASAQEAGAAEEAKEQQDDLELIARCFPEDLLLAVEALPSTIDALSEIPEASRGTDGDSYEIDEEDEDEDEEEEEEEVEVDYGPTAQGEGADEDGSADDPASPENGSQVAPSADSDASEQGLEPRPEDDGGLVAPPLPPHGTGGGSKSRRKRLRRRRISGNSSSTSNYGSAAGAAARGRGRRSPAAGPSLTAPFLTWLLWLEHCRRAAKQEAKAKPAARAFVVRAGALAPVLEACFRVLRFSQGVGGRGAGAAARLGPAQAVRVSRLDPRDPHDLARLALAVYFRTVHVFPALSRSWWADDCARGQRVWVADFTKRHVSPALIQIEAQVISEATDKGLWGQDGGEMSVRASSNSRQVVASYLKEECTLEAVIQLPPEYPLRNVEVTCSQRMGVSESRWRQWVLQIVTLLSLQDGSVLDAVMMWKKNVDKEFEGVEPCVICYSVLHPKTMDLPQMTCKTCSNKFHSSCLYKWFHTSHKNKCPICQQTWA
eukprot:g16294.t1